MWGFMLLVYRYFLGQISWDAFAISISSFFIKMHNTIAEKVVPLWSEGNEKTYEGKDKYIKIHFKDDLWNFTYNFFTEKCAYYEVLNVWQIMISLSYDILSLSEAGPRWGNDWGWMLTLLWRHNGRDGVSNHQPHDCLLNRLFRRRSKKISKLRVTGLCARNLPVTGEFPAQMASNVENVSI